QGNPQVELLLCPRWGVGEQLQDLYAPSEMGHRLVIRTPLEGILPRVAEILDRPVEVTPLHKMHCQLRRDLARPRPIPRLFPGADLQVPASLAARRHPVIQDFTIEVMAEAIARRDGPVRPGHEATGPEKLPLVGESSQPRLDVFCGLVADRGERRSGEFSPSETRGFQQPLVFRPEMGQLLLDDLAQAFRYRTPDRLNGLGDVPSRRLLTQEPLAYQLVDGRDQKQRSATGALMQLPRQVCHER